MNGESKEERIEDVEREYNLVCLEIGRNEVNRLNLIMRGVLLNNKLEKMVFKRQMEMVQKLDEILNGKDRGYEQNKN